MIDEWELKKLEVICKLNLIAGGLVLVLFAVPFYILFFTDLVLEPPIGLTNSLDRFNFIYLQRISLGSLYVSFGLVLWAGMAMRRKKDYARQLGHVSCVMVIYSSVITFFSYFLDYFRTTEIYAYLQTVKGLGGNVFVLYLFLFIVYGIYIRKNIENPK